MCRECRERFHRHWLQRNPQFSDPAMHHGTCVTHVPWCTSGSLTCGGGENVPGIPGTSATNPQFYISGKWPMQPVIPDGIHLIKGHSSWICDYRDDNWNQSAYNLPSINILLDNYKSFPHYSSILDHVISYTYYFIVCNPKNGIGRYPNDVNQKVTIAEHFTKYQALFWLFVDQIDLRLRLLAALSATQYASPRREA